MLLNLSCSQGWDSNPKLPEGIPGVATVTSWYLVLLLLELPVVIKRFICASCFWCLHVAIVSSLNLGVWWMFMTKEPHAVLPLRTEYGVLITYILLQFPRSLDLTVNFQHRTLWWTCDIVLHNQHGAQPFKLLGAGTNQTSHRHEPPVGRFESKYHFTSPCDLLPIRRSLCL
jgi:hypothetical protein